MLCYIVQSMLCVIYVMCDGKRYIPRKQIFTNIIRFRMTTHKLIKIMMKLFVFPLNIYKFYYFWEWTLEKTGYFFELMLVLECSLAHICTDIHSDTQIWSCYFAWPNQIVAAVHSLPPQLLLPPLGKPKWGWRLNNFSISVMKSRQEE